MIEVTCAIIEKNNKVLATQRAHNTHLAGQWEFPGGKIESGETAESCIKREIAEELSVRISVHRSLRPVEYHYPDKAIRLIPFVCKIISGQIRLTDHSDFRWLGRDELTSLDWAAADVLVLSAYLKSVDGVRF
jgi:8-oxo-dGTP diphosphatase